MSCSFGSTSSRWRAALAALGLGLGAALPAQDAPHTPACAVIELALPTADSMVATVREPRCGALRVVLTSAPVRVSPGEGVYMPERTFAFDLAIENAGDSAVALPLKLWSAKLEFVKYGRVHRPEIAREYGTYSLWTGRGMQQPWEFTAATGDARTLAPGARSGSARVTFVSQPLATGFLMTLTTDARHRDVVRTTPLPPVTPRLYGLTDGARQLVEAAQLPKLHGVREIFTDGARGLQFFSVSWGDGQDCPGGCFYSSAIGVSTGGRAGWLRADNYQSDTALDARLKAAAFVPTPDDDHLLSEELAQTVAGVDHGLTQVLLSVSIASPRIPRERLLRLVEEQYFVREGLLNDLLNAPAVRSDIELLTLLAFLPRGYNVQRITAQRLLAARASALLDDPTTSTRTLFAMWQGGGYSERDSVLVRRLAAHPNARASVAILAKMSWRFPWAEEQLLASVAAPPDVIAKLRAYLGPDTRVRDRIGEELLRDPRTAHDLQILTILAHRSAQEVAWAACRRLPEDALLCDGEYPLRPIRDGH